MLTLDDLLYAIPLAWNEETSGIKHAVAHPAVSQDIATVILIQRHCGGEIIHCEVGGDNGRTNHWFNEIDGVWIDLTAKQFLNRSPRRKFKAVTNKKFGQPYIDRADILERRVEDVLAWR